jgi:hypothetical protein
MSAPNEYQLRTSLEVNDLVIRWYARAFDAATLLKGAMALAALVALVVGAGAGWRWE